MLWGRCLDGSHALERAEQCLEGFRGMRDRGHPRAVGSGAGVVGQSHFDAIVTNLTDTNAAEFVDDFAEALAEADPSAASSYSVEAVAGSTEAVGETTVTATTNQRTSASSAARSGHAVPPQALLLAGVGGPLF